MIRPIQRKLAAGLLRAAGWRSHGMAPRSTRCIVIAAPHTSNWDLLWMLAFARSYGLWPRFMMKHSVFVGPLGPLFRWLGGIPIDRRRSGGVVKQMAEEFAAQEDLVLVVPPEGTRGRRDHWKSGFYHIAREAGVPICLSFLDYGERVAGFGPEMELSGNLRGDMEVIRDFYAGRVGRHPEDFGPVRLIEED